jgi:hypothetical protein
MRADCFYRAYNRDQARMLSERNVRCVSVEVDSAADLGTILAAGYAASGHTPFAHRCTGIYEVQTDRGIFSALDERALDPRSPRAAARVVFKSWDELEAEEVSGR